MGSGACTEGSANLVIPHIQVAPAVYKDRDAGGGYPPHLSLEFCLSLSSQFMIYHFLMLFDVLIFVSLNALPCSPTPHPERARCGS